MAVEETGYYDNFCVYCNGSGVYEDWDGVLHDCASCDGRGQWDDDTRPREQERVMGKPKPREYIVHEVLTVTNAYIVEASSKHEALEAAKERNGSDWMSEAVPTGGWFVEPRPRKAPDHMNRSEQ